MKTIIHGTYRLYRTNAAGELTFVRNVDYSYIGEKTPREAHPSHLSFDEMLDNQLLTTNEPTTLEDFEALVDAACEGAAE